MYTSNCILNALYKLCYQFDEVSFLMKLLTNVKNREKAWSSIIIQYSLHLSILFYFSEMPYFFSVYKLKLITHKFLSDSQKHVSWKQVSDFSK